MHSSLCNGILLTQNCTKPRDHKIDRITPHYMAAYWTGKRCCESFLPPARQASANYCIGYDGEIWCNVEEENRAWTSASAYNDNRAITIECANYTESWRYGQLPAETWDSLVLLCADICTRYGFRLEYTGDDSGNLTMHKWYASTDCPGPWLSQNFDRLAREVNALLDGTSLEDEMYSLIRLDGENGYVYFDGCNIHPLAHPDEMEAIKMAYRNTHNGAEIPMFDLGTPEAQWGNRLRCAINRKE